MFSMLFVRTLSLSLLSRVDLVPCLSVSLVPSLTFKSKLYCVLSVAEGGLRYKSIGEASLATLSGYGTNIYILLPPPICIWKPLIQKDRIEYYYSM